MLVICLWNEAGLLTSTDSWWFAPLQPFDFIERKLHFYYHYNIVNFCKNPLSKAKGLKFQNKSPSK